MSFLVLFEIVFVVNEDLTHFRDDLHRFASGQIENIQKYDYRRVSGDLDTFVAVAPFAHVVLLNDFKMIVGQAFSDSGDVFENFDFYKGDSPTSFFQEGSDIFLVIRETVKCLDGKVIAISAVVPVSYWFDRIMMLVVFFVVTYYFLQLCRFDLLKIQREKWSSQSQNLLNFYKGQIVPEYCRTIVRRASRNLILCIRR